MPLNDVLIHVESLVSFAFLDDGFETIPLDSDQEGDGYKWDHGLNGSTDRLHTIPRRRTELPSAPDPSPTPGTRAGVAAGILARIAGAFALRNGAIFKGLSLRR